MRNMNSLTLLLVLLAATGATGADPRDNAVNTGFQFMEEPLSPRSTGMGAVGTALPEGKGFGYYNPALPALQTEPYVHATFGRYPAGDMSRGSFETAWKYKKWFWGAGFATFSVADIIPSQPDGKVNWDLRSSWQQSIAHVTLGFQKERLGLGLLLCGAQDKIDRYTGWALATGLGAVFSLIDDQFLVGASLSPLGTTKGMLAETDEWGEGADLPLQARAGTAYTDTLGPVPLTLALDIVYRHADQRIMVPVGAEVRPLPVLSIRAGRRFGHDTEFLSLGFGLHIAPLGVDLSFVIPRLVEDVELKWALALSYTLQAPASSSAQPGTSTSHTRGPVVVTPDSAVTESAGTESAEAQTGGSNTTAQKSPLNTDTATQTGQSSDAESNDDSSPLLIQDEEDLLFPED